MMQFKNFKHITNRSALPTSQTKKGFLSTTFYTRNLSANTAKNWKWDAWTMRKTCYLHHSKWSSWNDELLQVQKRSTVDTKKYSMKHRNRNRKEILLDDELQRRRLYLLHNRWTQSKNMSKCDIWPHSASTKNLRSCTLSHGPFANGWWNWKIFLQNKDRRS